MYRWDEERGFLQVYSATRDFNDGNVLYFPHTSYQVRTAEGKHAKGVVNHIGLNDERPMTVPLRAGSYVVYAEAEGHGMVNVPVVIRRSWLTAVYLGGRGMPPSLTRETNQWVRLPGGQIVGPRARPGATD